jgi:hypothetical protein
MMILCDESKTPIEAHSAPAEVLIQSLAAGIVKWT